MEIGEVLENKMPKAIEYASHIIMETSNFIDFAVALVDYMDEDFIPYCKSVYAMLRSLDYPTVTFEKDDELGDITPDVIRNAYHNFLSKQEKLAREKEFKENIDELQFLVKSYRDSNEFKKMLDFIGSFPYLAPYNAMLVQMQKPGATFVLTGKKWAEYGRQPKLNGQKLIVLKPFGPVQCVFDYEDTEPIPNATEVMKEADLIKNIRRAYNKHKEIWIRRKWKHWFQTYQYMEYIWMTTSWQQTLMVVISCHIMTKS